MLCEYADYGQSSNGPNYLQYKPCDVCTSGSQNYPLTWDPFSLPYCLEPCDTADDIKYTRTGDQPTMRTYDQSTQWKCKRYTNNKLYWQIEKTEDCTRGVGKDGRCIVIEGEGEPCNIVDNNSCASNQWLLACANATSGSQGTTTALDCTAFGDVYDTPSSCITVDGVGMCAPNNPISCETLGETMNKCYEFEYGTAGTVRYICKKLSDTSLGYVIDIPSPFIRPSWMQQCESNKCNSDHSGCQ